MKEFYQNERPVDGTSGGGGGWGGSSSGSGGGSGGGGGSWGGSAGGGGGSAEGGGFGSSIEPEKWFIIEGKWKIHEQLMLLDGNGYILLSQDGEILQGMNGCIDIKVECQIHGDSGGRHVRCLLLTNSLDPEITGTLLDQFPASATKLFVRWQKGHYPHDTINTARFKINGKISRWVKLPLTGSYIEIAELTIRNGNVFVKYLI